MTVKERKRSKKISRRNSLPPVAEKLRESFYNRDQSIRLDVFFTVNSRTQAGWIKGTVDKFEIYNIRNIQRS